MNINDRINKDLEEMCLKNYISVAKKYNMNVKNKIKLKVCYVIDKNDSKNYFMNYNLSKKLVAELRRMLKKYKSRIIEEHTFSAIDNDLTIGTVFQLAVISECNKKTKYSEITRKIKL